MLAAAILAVAVINWVIGGGVLQLLRDVPVLLLLFPGLPIVAALAILIPDRPRTVRVYLPAGDLPEEVHVHVHHHHDHLHQVTHRHVFEGTVTGQRPVSHRVLDSAPMVIDGSVFGATRAIERGGESR